MSAVDSRQNAGSAPGVRFGRCAADIVEVGALRGRGDAVAAIMQQQGLTPPTFGRITSVTGRLILSVRPGRWLLLTAPERAGASAAHWRAVCEDLGVAIDLSSGLSAWHLAGAAGREMLARGCRLDLDWREFPVGRAAATVIAQVSVALAALPSGLLLLTPSTTARHFHEWVTAAAQPFAPAPQADFSVGELCGSEVA